MRSTMKTSIASGTQWSRRDLLRYAGGAAGTAALTRRVQAQGAARFHIGACDWSIGMRGRVEALALARQLGLDGVQVSMGRVSPEGGDGDLPLRQPEVQRAYREAAAASGVRIGGVALDVMNQVPYKADPRTEQWVRDSIDVASALGVRVILLAFFEKGDLRDDADGQREVIRRLRQVAPYAEKR